MVQGNLRQFELDFPLIKERAQLENAPFDDTPNCPPADQPSEKRETTSAEQAQDPQLTHTITDMKVKFTDLERELVQLRELFSHQLRKEEVHIPSTELSRLRPDREQDQAELSRLRTEIRVLQQHQESHIAALSTLTEEVKELREEQKLQDRGRLLPGQLESHPDHKQDAGSPTQNHHDQETSPT
ncbi:DnaJ-like protein subfamily A member 3%2C mitochondrial DnaJ protein Tid-1 [Xyrichtys novacula]|uniref:DnaJ-like protein subfamily A member 3, mitochondrial DnaJ protein Tid-1 n=1 Tax=Xyrichtys novacula TaxID=13765 RepID=A0AAV1EPY2_XYRNO|nr:DnaJ-like protein subfamily A member 3%2C mitochondrial DnaJ protein Tid-1 [Xyrichtys novacula]